MSDEKSGAEQQKRDTQAAAEARAKSESAAEGGAANAGAAGEGFDARAEIVQLKDAVETLEGQITDLTDRLLRAHADMENLRKRNEREREETAKYAITKFAKDVVDVGDNFQRAISAVPIEAAETDPALQSFLEGVILAEREFLNVLERHGVKRVAPQGEPFNPHLHQAVMEQEDTSVPPGTVLQVFQSGYVIEDRCLRPAMVVVSRGGAKATTGAARPDQGDPGGLPGEPTD